MIKKTLYFGNPGSLSRKDCQLVYQPGDPLADRVTIPIEDIGIIILDNSQTIISQALLAALMENGAAVMVCDSKHLPGSLLLPMASHHAFSEKAQKQMEASVPLKKNLWQQTVIMKVKNQAKLLLSLSETGKDILVLASKVKSGDSENIEGWAASLYWNRLFPDKGRFRRHRFGEPPNNLLNYGYSVLRAVVARSLVSSGLLPVLGIHHHNKYNPYCLADDIMEPYRPFVDKVVIEILEENDAVDELTPAIKRRLLSIPMMNVRIGNENSPLMVGTHRTTASLVSCFEGKTKRIIYPEIE